MKTICIGGEGDLYVRRCFSMSSLAILFFFAAEMTEEDCF